MARITKGEIKNANKQVLTNIYETEFTIENTIFRYEGDYYFTDGDKVALYAIPQGNGTHYVNAFYNITRDVFVPVRKLNYPIWSSIGWFLAIQFITIFIGVIIPLMGAFNSFANNAIFINLWGSLIAIGSFASIATPFFVFYRNFKQNKEIKLLNRQLYTEGEAMRKEPNN